MKEIRVSHKGKVMKKLENVKMLVDSGTQATVLPDKVADALHGALGASASKKGPPARIWYFDCEKERPTVEVVIGEQVFKMHPDEVEGRDEERQCYVELDSVSDAGLGPERVKKVTGDRDGGILGWGFFRGRVAAFDMRDGRGSLKVADIESGW